VTLVFCYSKGSSSRAAHILLEEVGAAYEAVEVPIANSAHRSVAFLARNPKGRIPVLETADGVLTENPAILEYIAATHQDAGCLPRGVYAQAQARSLAAYLCGTVHVAFAHHKRGARWATAPTSLEDMKAQAPRNLQDCAEHLEHTLALHPWALGETYSYCDPYLYLLEGWMAGVGGDLRAYPKLSAHAEAVRARPATQRVRALYGF